MKGNQVVGISRPTLHSSRLGTHTRREAHLPFYLMTVKQMRDSFNTEPSGAWVHSTYGISVSTDGEEIRYLGQRIAPYTHHGREMVRLGKAQLMRNVLLAAVLGSVDENPAYLDLQLQEIYAYVLDDGLPVKERFVIRPYSVDIYNLVTGEAHDDLTRRQAADYIQTSAAKVYSMLHPRNEGLVRCGDWVVRAQSQSTWFTGNQTAKSLYGELDDVSDLGIYIVARMEEPGQVWVLNTYSDLARHLNSYPEYLEQGQPFSREQVKSIIESQQGFKNGISGWRIRSIDDVCGITILSDFMAS